MSSTGFPRSLRSFVRPAFVRPTFVRPALFAALSIVSTLSATAESQWRVLFDGKSTDEFRNYQKDSLSDGWKVIDGALVRAENGAGDIITKKQFGSFELELEFRIAPGGNSGIMYHVTEDNPRPWHSGPEIQILDNKRGADPQRCGWLYQLYAADVDTTNPAGEWNQLRVVITPERCAHYMNGTKYVEYVKGSDDWDARVAESKFAKFDAFGKATKGHLCLQDHGDEVAYRNIRIRER